MRVTPSFPVAHRAGRLLASRRQARTDGDPRPRCLQTSRSKPPAGPPATPILTRHSAADSVSQAGGDEGGHAVSLAPIPVLPVGPGGPTAQRPHRRRRAGVGHRAAASSAAEGVNLTRAGSCLARLLPITASFFSEKTYSDQQYVAAAASLLRRDFPCPAQSGGCSERAWGGRGPAG